MGLEQEVGQDRFFHHIRAFLRKSGLRMGSNIGIGPTVETVSVESRQIVGHQPIALLIAFIDHHVKILGAGIKSDAHRVAQPRGETLAVRGIQGELLYRSTRQGFFAEIAARTDGYVEMRTVGVKGQIPRPVAVTGT